MNTRSFRAIVASALFLAVCGPIQAQPTILQQPASLLDQTLGSTASLCVTAQSSATTNLHYQWLRNGVIFPDATNSCLTISNLQAVNCGAFSVLVNDGVGVVRSEPADVTVSGVTILPGEDSLANGPILTQTNGVIRSSNLGAVKEPGTPKIIRNDPGGSEIWFQWSVPSQQSNGIVTFSTLGSDFDTTMGAYTGSAPANLVRVPTCVNDDDGADFLNSQTSFYATNGATYLIAVDGFYGAQGNVVLSWMFFAGSQTIPVNVPTPFALVASNGASVLLNDPWPENNCNWYLNGQLFASNQGVLLLTNLDDAMIGHYVAHLSILGGLIVLTEPSELEINTLQDGSADTNSISWRKFRNSADNLFAQPATGPGHVTKLGGGDTAGYSCSQTFSTVNNPREPGAPVVCNQVGGHPGWYGYVTPAAGSLLIDTAGSSFNTILGVFVGPGNSFSTLTNVACGSTTNYQSDGQPSVCITNVPAGQTNYIVVEGENGASGTVHLNIRLGAPVSITSPPLSQSVGPGSNVTLAVSASGATPLSYFWQFNGSNIAGATVGTLTVTNMQASNAGTYTVLVSNLVSEVSTQAYLSLASRPAILTQPASHTVTSNATATLSVSASGAPAPGYQWFAHGAPIGSDSSSLSISNFHATNQGTYSVILTNFMGAVTSAPALLLLDEPYRVNSYLISNGAFGFELAGPAGANFRIEASTNLLHWVPLLTNPAPSGIVDFTDTNTGLFKYRFYRGATN